MKHYYFVFPPSLAKEIVHNRRDRLSFLFIFFSVLGISMSYGQDDNYSLQLNRVTPVSPNTASLGIFGSIPVGHYTGVPSISIPLYEIKSGDVAVPISLSYHASGIKVAQEASSVGLGWALIAGGCITRELKHKDDFGSGGYYSDLAFPSCDENNNVIQDATQEGHYLNYFNGLFDSEPDKFVYNFGGMSGSFFFNKENTGNNTHQKAEAIISNETTYLKIVYNNRNSELDESFEITDAYGNIFTFGSSINSREHIRTYSQVIPQDVRLPDEEHWNKLYESFEPGMGGGTTAWYLEKITTAKKDIITFEYEKEQVYSPVRVSEEVYSGIEMRTSTYTESNNRGKSLLDLPPDVVLR